MSNTSAHEGKGFVYIVGAGSGVAGQLTLDAKAAIEKADVIIFDRLLSVDMLGYARPDCELIFVGKPPKGTNRPQREVNELLVTKAKEGKIVVRLKGGDPFIFGRGSEEALELKRHGIACEVVPGMSAAISVPAYAGIPLTKPGVSTSITMIAGNGLPENLVASTSWEYISKTTGTLVILMGVGNLAIIVSKLIEHGMDPTTPVAIVERGVSPKQRTLCGDLNTIVSLVKQHRLKNPAVVIVGKVVSLHEELQWHEGRPLSGRSFLVTKAKLEDSALTAVLADLGARILEVPAIVTEVAADRTISPEVDEKTLKDSLANSDIDSITFTSPALVHNLIDLLDGDITLLLGLKLYSIDSVVSDTLRDYGLSPAAQAASPSAESLVEAIIADC